MSPVSPVLHTVVTVKIGLKKVFRAEDRLRHASGSVHFHPIRYLHTWPHKSINHIPQASKNGDISKLSHNEHQVISNQVEERSALKVVNDPTQFCSAFLF